MNQDAGTRAGVVAAVVLTVAGACSCSGEGPSSVWDDLSGTVYFLSGAQQDSIRAVNPRTGEVSDVPGAPEAFSISAPTDGSDLVISRGFVLRFNLRTGQTSVLVPEEDEVFYGSASVSPDGRRIVYVRSDRQGYSLIVRDSGGSDPKVVYGVTQQDPSQPGWLDNETLVFLAAAGGATRLWSVRADGSQLGFFSSDTGLIVDAVQPSPRTGRLLVVRRPTGSLPDELWELDRTGHLLRRLASIEDGLYPWFAWSPDEAFVAYCAPTPTSDADLMVLHVTSGQERSLTTGPGYECEPVWIP